MLLKIMLSNINNNPAFKSCLLRITGLENSKYLNKAEKKKIIQDGMDSGTRQIHFYTRIPYDYRNSAVSLSWCPIYSILNKYLIIQL
jgi:hypothetical protein